MERDSILNQSAYFHVLRGLLPDIMHDILEGKVYCTFVMHDITHLHFSSNVIGVLQLTMMVMLREFICNRKLFQVQTLNHRIKSFCYGPVDATNKPSTMNELWFRPSNTSCMKQSGMHVEYEVSLAMQCVCDHIWCFY